MKPSKNKTVNPSLAGKSVIKPTLLQKQLVAYNMTAERV